MKVWKLQTRAHSRLERMYVLSGVRGLKAVYLVLSLYVICLFREGSHVTNKAIKSLNLELTIHLANSV